MKLHRFNIGAFSDPWSELSAIDAAAQGVSDPSLETFMQKWPVLSAKLLALDGLSQYGPEELPFVRAAGRQLETTASHGLPVKAIPQIEWWLNSATFPPFADDFSYVDRKRAEHYAEESPFIFLACQVLPNHPV